ncbi:Lrp/AsnC family transcriptional regulator [Leucobacter chromiireducens]|uniref:Lrp/AsnC family transcriptional regulator n=1 Tax=Leucobacter chromiireducens subsp. chromiireducens TaxID=660067 RepID=A0ABS1SKP9_9MICO|nr:Lrp/AsnC family transcriptional regulator [Leucobacter chromiireducens]MBL3688747.1 Lrp/AsnC family transcriptional regulator [Leucobacter chromiireducens subsp. chromiireducens]
MLDEVDRRLIEMLARDGRRSFASLAEELGVSQSTVRARLAKLREDDALQIVALCNALLLGHQVVRLLLRVRNLTPRSVANGLLGIKQINHVALVAGSHDLYLEATCRDQPRLIDLMDEIRRHPGVAAIQPIIVTSLAKDYTWEGLRGTAGQSISDPDG